MGKIELERLPKEEVIEVVIEIPISILKEALTTKQSIWLKTVYSKKEKK